MKFFVDEMLGKLARWLRLAGLDARYERGIADQDLVARARAEQRIILTRDTRLMRELHPEEGVFIAHDRLEDQFEQFRRRFPGVFQGAEAFSRCADCNTPLVEIPKEEAKGKTFPYVYYTQDRFRACPDCQRLYWDATHVGKIRSKLDKLLEKN